MFYHQSMFSILTISEGMYWTLTISEGASALAGVVASAVPLSPPRIPPMTSPKSPRSWNSIDCWKFRKGNWTQWLLWLDCQLYLKDQKSLRFPRWHPRKVLDPFIWLIVEKTGWETIIVIVDYLHCLEYLQRLGRNPNLWSPRLHPRKILNPTADCLLLVVDRFLSRNAEISGDIHRSHPWKVYVSKMLVDWHTIFIETK